MKNLFSLQRIKELFTPQYRTRFLVFVLLYFILLILAWLAGNGNINLGQVLFEFATTMGAVAALQILWDFLGGDPMEIAIDNLKQSSVTKDEFDLVNANLQALYKDVSILGDLEKTGIDRLWPTRKIWQSDHSNGLDTWKERIFKAENIDILSDSFWSNWFQYQDFRTAFENRVKEKRGVIRILLLRPYSSAIRQRSYDQGASPSFLSNESILTLNELRGMMLRIPNNKCLQVRVNGTAMNNYQILRTDDYMLVASYLMRESGGPSPTIQLRRGTKQSYFFSYANHFDNIWKESVNYWSDDMEKKILELFVTKQGDVDGIIENMELDTDILNRISVITGLHEYTIKRCFEKFTQFSLLANRQIPHAEIAYIVGISEDQSRRYKELYDSYNIQYTDRLNLLMKISFTEWGERF